MENLVKQCKRLIAKSIKRTVLQFTEFELFVTKAKYLINRRPIAFQEGLRESCANFEVPTPITPENLLKGYDSNGINLIPQLECTENPNDLTYKPPEEDNNFIRENFKKLRNVSKRLRDSYHYEFLTTLVRQSVDRKDRYAPVLHKPLAQGDIVLLVEPNLKQQDYPMGIIKEIENNSLGEVTAARVFKGKTRELVYRHASSLILLLQNHFEEENNEKESVPAETSTHSLRKTDLRSASKKARHKIRNLLDADNV